MANFHGTIATDHVNSASVPAYAALPNPAAVVLFPPLLWFIGPREPVFVRLALVIAVLIVAHHKDNIRRLVR